jgi:DNA polymerase-3 subunit delta'
VSWKRVRGHDAQVRAFAQIIARGRLAHAYLFTGPPGVGKRLFARELAKALLCEAPHATGAEACDECDACAQVEADTHPDFFQAARPEDSLDVPIETVRELCRGLSLKPARGRRKVALLDDADDLNEYAANCFLKTLEEPPPGSVLLLIGTSSDRQLSTLVSRCQVVRFAPLSEALVAELLREQEAIDPPLIPKLARMSDGSPGQAIALADPELWEFRRKFLTDLTRPGSDAVALAEAWTHFVEEAGKESAAQRRRAALVLRLLIGLLRDALCVNVGGSPRLAEPEDLQMLQRLQEKADPEKLIELLERCLESDVQVDRRVQLVLIQEALLDAFGSAKLFDAPATGKA